MRKRIPAALALASALLAGGALAQDIPDSVTVLRIGRTEVSGAPRARDVDAAFDQLVDPLRACAAGGLGAIDGVMDLRLVVHGDGTVTNAVVATRPTGATSAFVLCVTGVARRMRLPSFRAHDAAVVLHVRVRAPAAAARH